MASLVSLEANSDSLASPLIASWPYQADCSLTKRLVLRVPRDVSNAASNFYRPYLLEDQTLTQEINRLLIRVTNSSWPPLCPLPKYRGDEDDQPWV